MSRGVGRVELNGFLKQLGGLLTLARNCKQETQTVGYGSGAYGSFSSFIQDVKSWFCLARAQ
jgi:hypothetical protein